MPSAIKLIVGLGNPGPEYSLTRHNAGFWFIDVLANAYGLVFKTESRFKSEVCRISSSGADCLLCKPMTSMNCSGLSVQAISSYYKIPAGEILVAHDEIDFDPGTIRFKDGGGHAGHNGLRDIIEKLGDNSFKRLRIGVGHPGASSEVINSVLGRPPAEEARRIMESIGQAIELMPLIFAGEFQKAMNTLHTSEKPDVKSGNDTNE